MPKIAIHNAKSENCEYTNYSGENRNCYLLVGGLGSQDCLYSYRIFYSTDVVDSYDLYKCELCYECRQSTELFQCIGTANSHSSSFLVSCENCIGCQNCFACSNLRNQSWQAFNQPCSREEYKRLVEAYLVNPEETQRRFAALKATDPLPENYVRNCEASRGDQLLNCQRCVECFTLKNSQDCSHSAIGENDKDCLDCNFFDNCELQYFCTSNEKNYNVTFASLVWYTSDSSYLMNCFNSSNLFGCSGTKKQKYCLLNKQYTKIEYEALVQKVIVHMKETGEWGKFFSPAISPFAYNETAAFDKYPLSKEDALSLGYRWLDEEIMPIPEIRDPLPCSIEEVPDAITEDPLVCSESGKSYRITKQELAFYRKLGIPLPDTCPDVRHRERMSSIR